MKNETNARSACLSGMPENERPYEKCRELGPEVLTDTELLAVILRTGTKGMDVLETARAVLELRPSMDGLLSLHHLTRPELMQIPGIGEVKAIQLTCIGEISKRMSRRSMLKGEEFTSPDIVAAYFMESMRHLEKEVLRVAFLNTKGRLLHDSVISVGTVNCSLISPREIFIEALEHRAVSIVMLHNHPSGDPTPSSEDIAVTQRVAKAGEMLGITLTDHIIIGDNCYISLKERRIF